MSNNGKFVLLYWVREGEIQPSAVIFPIIIETSEMNGRILLPIQLYN